VNQGIVVVVNVRKLRASDLFIPGALQVIEDFDYSDFCTLLEAETAERKTELNGMTILQYPYASIICHGDHCTCIATPGASVAIYLREAHEELERRGVEAAA
jgi:hypothetical protein